jgi:hypothetical protein
VFYHLSPGGQVSRFGPGEVVSLALKIILREIFGAQLVGCEALTSEDAPQLGMRPGRARSDVALRFDECRVHL